MKIATKLLVLLLAVLMCVSCFASCGSSDVTTTSETTTTPPEGPQEPEQYENKLLDDKTFSGQTCTIYYKNGCGPSTSLWITDAGISSLDRAAFSRLQTINERTGITIFCVESSYNGAPYWTEDIWYLRGLMSSNDVEQIPDIVMPGGYCASILAGEGLFLDLGNENPYINLDMPCWNRQMNNELSICGTYYGVSGLFATSNIAETSCVFVDKTALASLNPTTVQTVHGGAAAGYEDMDTLYEWARNGEWTYKKMLALAAAFAGENGSIATPGQESDSDKWGLEYQGTSSYSIFMATGKKYVSNDDGLYGIPSLMIDDAETMQVLNWLVDNVQSKPYVRDWGGEGGAETLRRFGLSHSVLFSVWHVIDMPVYSALGSTDSSVNGTFDYGILPMPKFDYEDKQQESYCGAMNAWWATLACIAKNCRDTDFSSFVLQLITEMGYYPWEEGVTTIWDAYITEGLYGRYAPDKQDEEMLDLVLESMTADLGEFNLFAEINVANSIRDMYRSGNTTWQKWVETNGEQITSGIYAMLEKMGLVSYS